MGVKDRILNLIYPPRCPLCERIWDGFCPDCRAGMKVIREPYCFKCGKQLKLENEEYCSDCRHEKHQFIRGRALLRYEGREKEIIHRIKYDNRREYLVPLAEEMAERFEREVKRWQIDQIVPIPMYPAKKRKRGFNQAELLANLLGERFELPVSLELLIKKEDTGEQKELSLKERKENLRSAFEAEDCEGLRILLVDDVYTTGSTMDAATQVLSEAGAEAVYYVCICAGNGEN